MNENKESVLEKQKRRYQFLLELWKVVKGSSDEQANLYVVAGSLGFSLEETWELHSYFSEKGFFAMDTSAMDITLSHRAIVEIENSLTNPQQSTEHFPSTVIQNFNAPVEREGGRGDRREGGGGGGSRFQRDRGPRGGGFRDADRGPRNFDRASGGEDRGPRNFDRAPRNFGSSPRGSEQRPRREATGDFKPRPSTKFTPKA